jgi:hypothetical protein
VCITNKVKNRDFPSIAVTFRVAKTGLSMPQ